MPVLAFMLIAGVWLYQAVYESTARRLLEPPAVRIALTVAMILYLLTAAGSSGAPFIYFQF